MILKNKIISIIFIMISFYLMLIINPFTNIKSYAAVVAGTLSRDIDGIDENAYPGFKTLIKTLSASHPNYTFLVYYTGLDWNEAITAEYQGHGHSPKNLFQVKTKYDGMWKCPICGNSTFDNGSWSCASTQALEYMMDPRNSINESDVFQFKDLEGCDVSVNEIRSVVSSYGSYLNNEEVIQAIYDSCVQYRINPFFVVAKIVNEQGMNGTTLSAGKGYNGQYVGVYNYFNIGAYGNGTSTIIKNGLSYAQSKGWTSRRAAIFGGVAEIRNSYMDSYSQNTYYYQKFNVSGKSTLASHQYQQNIMAAQTQGTSYKSYYTKTNSNGNFTFIIPLYNGMSKTAYARPDYTKANSISYINGRIQSPSNLTVKASPNGTSIGVLNNGEELKILLRSTGQIGNSFWDLVVSKKDGTYGYVARDLNGTQVVIADGETINPPVTPKPEPEPKPEPKPEPEKPTIEVPTENQLKVNGNYLEMVPTITVEQLISKYGDKISIKDSSNKSITSGLVATGYSVKIDDKTYKISKRGDVNGDGYTNVLDVVTMLNVIKGEKTLSDEYYRAGIVENSSNATFTVIDAVKILNYIKNNDSSLNF